jgi:hypothetical protein
LPLTPLSRFSSRPFHRRNPAPLCFKYVERPDYDLRLQ